MRVRTAIILFLSFFNALWLAHVFLVLGLVGEYPVREPVAWIAWGEFALCILLAGAIIERLLHLKEKR